MCVFSSVTFIIVVIFSLFSLTKSLKINPASRINKGTDVVFPEVIDETEIDFVPKISKHKCKIGETFCEHTDAYPYRLVQNLENEEQYKYLFGVDEDQIISDRLDENEFVCASKSLLIFPKAALNSKNQWKYIVNQGNGREQGIRVEVCQREGSQCKLLTKELYKTACRQKYAYRRLLAISYDGKIEPDSFLLPVACCCSYKPRINWNPAG